MSCLLRARSQWLGLWGGDRTGRVSAARWQLWCVLGCHGPGLCVDVQVGMGVFSSTSIGARCPQGLWSPPPE